jgi:hypothetical protein
MRLEIMVQVRALRSGLVVVVVVPALMISRMSERMEVGTAIRIVIVRLMLLLI